MHSWSPYYSILIGFADIFLTKIQNWPFCHFNSLRVYLNRTYFAKNLKHCNKIIFKCVNSTMKLIFNEKIAEK